jgi:DNA-binding PadR family transcriptional regulator
MYVDILILAYLSVRPQHGYEIKKNVEQVLGREISLNNGMLYPALRRFEEMGAVERTVERQQGKPDRHIYHLTPLGHTIMHDLLTEFPPELARNDAEFLVRVSFFDVLEPQERLDILAARSDILRDSLTHHERIRASVDAEQVTIPDFGRRVMAFEEQQTRDELAWIEELRHVAAQEEAIQ